MTMTPLIRRLRTTALALAALALLTACGGGGPITDTMPGTGSSPTSTGSGGGGGPDGGSSLPPSSNTNTSRNAAFTADPAQVVAAGRAIVQSNPVFGSVHQSAHVGRVAAVTDVTVTPQPGESFDFVITRADGSRTSLNSRRQGLVAVPVDSPTGRTAESGALLDWDSTRITVAAVSADYDPNDLGIIYLSNQRSN